MHVIYAYCIFSAKLEAVSAVVGYGFEGVELRVTQGDFHARGKL